MLILKPSCEHCNTPLPPDSTEAMICTFECTFCTKCVEEVLQNVCPNCAGGFCLRPIRPKQDWIDKVSLEYYSAETEITHKPVDVKVQQALIKKVVEIPPYLR